MHGHQNIKNNYSSLGRTVTKIPLESRLVSYFSIPIHTP